MGEERERPHGKRQEGVDFWRGLVLMEILVNHTPYSTLDYLTHRNFGFSDGSEVFVFISGLAVSLAYWPMIERGELRRATVKAVRRAGRLYWFHLAMTLAALALFGGAFLLTANEAFIAGNPAFTDPLPVALGTLLLSYQLGFFNILPLYVVLLAFVPAFFLLVHRNLALGLALSAAVYLAARLGLRPPDWPEGGGWFFNPFAWQVLFALGIAAGVLARRGGLPRSRLLAGAAGALLLFALAVVTGGFGLAPELANAIGARLDLGKYELGTARLCHFLALAYLVSFIPVERLVARLPGLGAVSRMGRQGLGVFTVGSMVSAFGLVVAIQLESLPASMLELRLAGLAVALAGIAGSVLLARWLERGAVRPGAPVRGAA